MDGPEVGIVVLNHGDPTDTMRCLEALARSRHRDAVAVVVDNGSGPDHRSTLARGLDVTPLLATDANLGYAGGNNVGIRWVLDRDVRFVLLVNPDVLVRPDTLGTLVSGLRRDPRIGVAAPRLVNGGSRPTTIWYDGAVIDWSRGGATAHVRSGVPLDDAPTRPAVEDTAYATGACMLTRAEVFRDVGLLPTDWFLYFEETEFNLLAQRAGYRTVVVRTALAEHWKRSSGPLPRPYYVYYYVRNRVLFGARHSDRDVDVLVEDVMQWVHEWRAKVVRNDPSFTPTFDRLVAGALDDARAGRTGPRDLDELVDRPAHR